MRRLVVFNSVSLDGHFVDMNGDMSWAKNPIPDAEWDAFGAENAKGGGMLLFGRVWRSWEAAASSRNWRSRVWSASIRSW